MFKKAKKAPRTIFYPASYLVMTVTSLLFLWAITGLGTMLIYYWLTGVSDLLNDTFIIYWIASLLVVTPMHLMAYWQVRHTDKANVTTFSLRFAHGLLGLYLLVVMATYIALVTWLIAVILNALVGTGEFDKHLLAAVLSLLQAIIIFKYAASHFVGVRSGQSQPKPYTATISIVTTAVIALSLVFPVMAYRDVARDFVKENDLWQISQSVGDYADTHDALPSKLTDLSNLSDETVKRLGDYQYTSQGETKFGILGYQLCATFARNNDKGHDTGFGFASHSSGNQCFVRTTISFTRLSQDIAKYAKDDATKLQQAIQGFLAGAKRSIDQEIGGVETFASGQLKLLERDLEGLEGGTTQLQQEMNRLEGNLGGLEGDTGELAQDFAAVEKFLHDLGCLFGGCNK